MGPTVFQCCPNPLNRMMLADPQTTIAVAEWEPEELGKKGLESSMALPTVRPPD
jgi:hypothetical protein